MRHYCSAAFLFFFFNDTATTEIYTLSLHDALPICVAQAPGDPRRAHGGRGLRAPRGGGGRGHRHRAEQDRKSTRLNSSHLGISYVVFRLDKKTKTRPMISPIQSQDPATTSL